MLLTVRLIWIINLMHTNDSGEDYISVLYRDSLKDVRRKLVIAVS